MLRKLAYYDNSILRIKAKPVEQIDSSVRQLIQDMQETMHHHDGAGLAAPQVYESLAIFFTCIPYKTEDDKWVKVDRLFINPKILKISPEVWTHHEGCLSIPGLELEIERPAAILIEATDLERERFQEELRGWEARTFLHENDHLNGVLTIDRVKGKKRKEIEPILRIIKKKYCSKTAS